MPQKHLFRGKVYPGHYKLRGECVAKVMKAGISYLRRFQSRCEAPLYALERAIVPPEKEKGTESR